MSLRGFPPIPTLEKLILKGNPIETHELYRPMCLLAVGHSLLRLDDEGIQLDTREAAYVVVCTRHCWLTSAVLTTCSGICSAPVPPKLFLKDGFQTP